MKKIALVPMILFLALTASGKFKAKNIKPKKAEQFQSRAALSGVTYAADLLIKEKDQKKYFQQELTTSNLIAVRLAVFNNGKDEVILPLNELRLVSPDGEAIPPASPETVAQAVLGGTTVDTREGSRLPQVGIASGGGIDPRTDPSDPRYDPRLDPNSPQYDPGDPRNRDRYPPGSYPPGTTPGSYPPEPYPSGGTMGRPGIVINPGAGGDGSFSQIERQLAEKDYISKAHTAEPIPKSMKRDRFLYFSIPKLPASTKGYALHLPAGKGIPREVVLEF
jgi:hypothetical protein